MKIQELPQTQIISRIVNIHIPAMEVKLPETMEGKKALKIQERIQHKIIKIRIAEKPPKIAEKIPMIRMPKTIPRRWNQRMVKKKRLSRNRKIQLTVKPKI